MSQGINQKANPYNFLENAFNQMFLNPRATENEKKDQHELKSKFEELFGTKNYFLFPSSGTSTAQNVSVKLIALHRQSVLNSAARVNTYFNFKLADNKYNFGCVLPTFHVGGLGIYARAFLAQAPVFQMAWKPSDISIWTQHHQINIISLVPAQIYDIVLNNVVAPKCIKYAFVGGAQLAADLKAQAVKLNWPLIETYGMTETASMIAVSRSDNMQALPEVEMDLVENKLRIKCNSLMTCSLQKIDNQIHIIKPENGWLQTSDLVELRSQGAEPFLTFLGRDSDFIKINGEGVSLSLLRQIFGVFPTAALMAFAHARSEFEIVLVYQKNSDIAELYTQINHYNLKVRPFEKVKKMMQIQEIPKTELGKIKYKILEEAMKGLKYEDL